RSSESPRRPRAHKSGAARRRPRCIACVSAGAAGASCSALERAALVLRQAAPDTGVLVGLERVLEAHLGDRARRADGLGLLDLLERWAGVADREEQLGVYREAGSVITPTHT